MKPSVLCILALALVGCAAPLGNTVLALPPVNADTKDLIGYAIDEGDWYCYRTPEPGDDCDICLNISGHTSRLSTGKLRADGRWDVAWQRFAPDSRVRLCRPPLKRMAQSYK